MSFLYHKPLSIEEIFSRYNSNGGEKIDKADVENAKNIKIFEGFKIQENWTLEDFERENLETYKQYEILATKAFSKQQENIHIKFLRVQYDVKEGSENDIRDGETVEDFEIRLMHERAIKDYQNIKDEEQKSARNSNIKFGLNGD